MTKSDEVNRVGPKAISQFQSSSLMNRFSITIQIRGLSTPFKVTLLALRDIASFGCLKLRNCSSTKRRQYCVKELYVAILYHQKINLDCQGLYFVHKEKQKKYCGREEIDVAFTSNYQVPSCSNLSV